MQICIPILSVMRLTQNTNDSINSILQHGRVVDNNCSAVFPTSLSLLTFCVPEKAN